MVVAVGDDVLLLLTAEAANAILCAGAEKAAVAAAMASKRNAVNLIAQATVPTRISFYSDVDIIKERTK
jgi:hypothetical protein